MIKSTKSILLLFLLLLLPSACLAAERKITAAELQTLQTELKLQDALLSKAEVSSQKSQLELATLREQLKTSETELLQLTQQLEKLKLKSKANETRWQNAEQALEDANKSLLEYKKEVQKKQKRLKMQRNIAYFLLAGTAVALVKK